MPLILSLKLAMKLIIVNDEISMWVSTLNLYIRVEKNNRSNVEN